MSVTNYGAKASDGPVNFLGGIRVGKKYSPKLLKAIGAISVAVDPASIAAGATGDTQVSVTGAAVGDLVLLNPPSTLEAGLVFGGAFVNGAGTVKVRLGNVTSGAIDGASKTWTGLLLKLV